MSTIGRSGGCRLEGSRHVLLNMLLIILPIKHVVPGMRVVHPRVRIQHFRTIGLVCVGVSNDFKRISKTYMLDAFGFSVAGNTLSARFACRTSSRV